jgi:glycosyltransferase involved in cell wall biosynthesis
MKSKILFIERKFWGFVSIEKVFEQIARNLDGEKFKSSFVKVLYGNSLSGILRNLLFFRKTKADIYHITGHIHYLALVLPRKNTILTIHDLGFLHIRKGLRRYIIKKLFLDLPVKRLKYITAISETTKKEIIATTTNCSPDKIIVIENPIQEQYLNSEKKEFSKDCPTILQVGTLPNKNVSNLIKALNGINCTLKLIGELDETLLSELKKNQINFENASGLDDLQIKNEYQKADIVAFCSTYEGFGLPIIEAQAMKKPVITSNLSPMREVSGGAAMLINPFDFESIRAGVLEIINNDSLREDLLIKGVKNIVKFEPKNIAEQYESLYVKVLVDISK